MERKRYRNIDGLRAYAAIGIVLMHVLANGYALNGFVFKRLIPSFSSGVYLFMMISGFSMCCGYYQRFCECNITPSEFYSKRYGRILPFFAVLCLMDIAVSPSVNSIYEIFANLTLCFGLLPNPKISVIGVGWFLGVVFVFYLMFPFFCFLLKTKKRAWFSFGIALVFQWVCRAYFFNSEHINGAFDPRTNIVYCFVFFLAGGLIYLYRDKIEKIPSGLFLIFCIAASFWYLLMDNRYVMMIMQVLWLKFAVSSKETPLLSNPVSDFISKISMEIYLCHMLIFRIVQKMGLLHLFKSEELSFIAVSAAVLVGAAVFALVMTKVIEFGGKKLCRKN